MRWLSHSLECGKGEDDTNLGKSTAHASFSIISLLAQLALVTALAVRFGAVFVL
jgi:hypothetical protein